MAVPFRPRVPFVGTNQVISIEETKQELRKWTQNGRSKTQQELNQKFVGGSSSRLVLGIDEHLHTNNQLTIGVSFGIQTNESKEIQNSFTVHSAKKEKDRSANAAVIHHRSIVVERNESITYKNELSSGSFRPIKDEEALSISSFRWCSLWHWQLLCCSQDYGSSRMVRESNDVLDLWWRLSLLHWLVGMYVCAIRGCGTNSSPKVWFTCRRNEKKIVCCLLVLPLLAIL